MSRPITLKRALFLTALAFIVGRGLPFAKAEERDEFQDCTDCPVMILVPAGHFDMGAQKSELDREGVGPEYASWEQPVHRVTIPRSFAVGKFEVTRREFAAFVAATGHEARKGCHADFGATRAEFQKNDEKSWRDPGFEQEDDHPVVCVGWDEARAYAAWLSSMTGKTYRLPTEAEWEYVARAGTTATRYWGDDRAATCTNANGTDESAMRHFSWTDPGRASPCNDGFVFTAPVGTFTPNPFGIYDTLGNAWEWVEDCFTPNYLGAPTDGRARQGDGGCQQRVFRGGGWLNSPVGLRAAARGRRPVDGRFNVGIRVMREVE